MARAHAVKPHNARAQSAERLAQAQDALAVWIDHYDAMALFVLAYDGWKAGSIDWASVEQARELLRARTGATTQ